MEIKSGRKEKRIRNVVAVQLISQEDPSLRELTATENINSRGARVESRNHWKRGDRLLLQSLSQEFRSRARVIYCEELPSGKCAMGLQFTELLNE